MRLITPLLILSAALLFSCGEKKPVDRMTDEQLRSYADELAHKYIITDGHVDLPERLKEKNFIVDRIGMFTAYASMLAGKYFIGLST